MHLHLHSFYSFLAGTLSIDRIIEQAGRAGYTALALTDTNNVTGVMEFYVKCRRAGIKPVIGAELRAGPVRCVALARSWDGYAAICRALTELVISYPPARVVTDEGKDAMGEDAATGEGKDHLGTLSEILRRHADEQVILLSAHEGLLSALDAIPAERFVELCRHDEGRWPSLQRIARERGLRTVATNDVYFGAPKGRKLHGILRAIATNTTLGTLPPGVLAPETAYFIGEEEFQRCFADIPDALAARRDILDACTVEFDCDSSKFTRYRDVPDNARLQRLRTLTEEGFLQRYPDASPRARERI
ncbi:MAG: PHP domain-containing protein, partial [Bacteroidota bacterium]|nr:PHP domain-containing protein [Bacteroidota bacterium]